MAEAKYRLVTRSDFDGLVCATLLRELEMIEEVVFVHPKDMQDGKVVITGRDITTNLPYVEGAYLVFDHHASETERFEHSSDRWAKPRPNYVIDAKAPSAARVVYKYFGGKEQFPGISDEMMLAVDQADSAHYSRADILAPRNWTLLNFIMDPRTGLGRFRNFTVSNYQLMMELIGYCRTHTIQEILALPDVKERLDLYREQEYAFIEQLERCSHQEGSVVIVDLRHQEPIYAGNRFMIYALYPTATVSVHLITGFKGQNTVLAVGKSIVNRRSLAHIGSIMIEFGGGGHDAAGSCQVEDSKTIATLEKVVKRLNQHG
ncbi:MAG: exopolyphosphatase [Rhodospirillaceae bacterium]